MIAETIRDRERTSLLMSAMVWEGKGCNRNLISRDAVQR
jgi:hypothetical protein